MISRIASIASRTTRHPGIKWRVVLLSLLIPMVCASGGFIWEGYQVRRDAIAAEARYKSALVNAHLEKFISSARSASEGYAFTWPSRHEPAPTDPAILEHQTSRLRAFVDSRRYFSRGFITDSDGVIIVSTEPSLTGKLLGGQELYQKAYREGGLAVSDVIVIPGETPFVLFVQPLRWDANETKGEGFLALQSELGTISESLDLSVGFPRSVKAGIFDSQGRLLAGAGYEEPHPGLMVGKDFSGSELWAKAKTGPGKQWFGKGLAGTDRLISSWSPESTPWITTVSYARSELFEPLSSWLWIVSGMLVISVTAIVWVSELLIRRESRLLINLEERVEERTAELSLANQALKNEVAERARVEEALRKSEEQQKALIAAIPDLILQIKEDGSILSVKSTDVLQLPALVEAPPGNQISQAFPSGVSQLYLEHTQQALEAGRVQLFEHDLLVADEMRSCEVRLTVSGKGQVVAIVRDITERKRLEEQFLLSHKMDSVGRLAGGVAHEFNNLLAAILGFSALALETSASTSMIRGYLQEIQKAGERAANLTRQLLTFSRKRRGEAQPFDLNELVIDTSQLLRPIIGENIELALLPAEGLKPVKADRSQIEQILVNLATNARDAMPQGGKLVIKTSGINLNHPDDAQGFSLPPGEYAALTFTDTGAGMTEEVKSHVFEPFFTTKGVGQGTGLGLAVCYGIVAQSGGYIEIDSVPGQGSAFTVYLPCADADLSRLPPANSLDYPDLARGSETVLLVEDEPLVRNLASHVLRKQGYTVLEASNGINALSLAQAPAAPQIDLVLTDVVMPQMGGRELVSRLQSMFPNIRALFMSGYAEEFMSYHDPINRDFGFIEKPFMPNALVIKVREVIDTPYPKPHPRPFSHSERGGP